MDNTETKSKKEETILRILDAALKVFAEAGFNGARVDEIARCAGVNKAMLYYHIGDKKVLYAEVLHRVFSAAVEKMASSLEQIESAEEKLRTFIRVLAEAVDMHPEAAVIQVREAASGGQNMPDIIAQDLAGIVGFITDILQQGEREGVFIKASPILVHMMLIGGIVFFKTTVPVRKRVVAFPEAVRNMDEMVSGRISEEVEKLVLRAIRK